MNERHCHRCGSELHIESEGALVYCFHCGAPQLVLSEELREQSDERLRLEQEASEHERQHPQASHAKNAVDWKLAIKLVMGVSGGLALLSVVLPPLGFLVFAWAPVAPAIVMSLYATRGRHSHFSSGSGARIGSMCGAFIVLGLVLLNTIALDLWRFVFHRSDFDTALNLFLTQLRTQVTAQSGAQAADMLHVLNVPEFRAGAILISFALTGLIVMLLATGGGALAGSFQKRRRVS